MEEKPKNQPSPEEVARAIYMHAADLMKNGMSDYQVEKALVDKGLNEADARAVVRNLGKARSSVNRDAALKNMGVGALICIVGIVITAATYSAAANSPGGGRYVVAWGAVIFGGIQFLRGLFQLMTSG